MILQETGNEGTDRINLAQAPVTGFCGHGSETSGFLTSENISSYSKLR